MAGLKMETVVVGLVVCEDLEMGLGLNGRRLVCWWRFGWRYREF